MSALDGDPGHEQVRVELGDRSAEVDAGLAPLILACWREGLETLSSCEEIEPGRAFVTFPTREQAERFAWIGGADELALREPGSHALALQPDEEGRWSVADEPLSFVEGEEPPRTWTLVRQRGVEVDASGHGRHDDDAAFVYSVAFSTDDLRAMLAAITEAEGSA